MRRQRYPKGDQQGDVVAYLNTCSSTLRPILIRDVGRCVIFKVFVVRRVAEQALPQTVARETATDGIQLADEREHIAATDATSTVQLV
jgi:hypothetical protein